MLNLTARDLAVNWHPYTQMKTANKPIGIVRAKDTLLFDEQGNSYMDAVSSWWVTLHGHANNYIAEKVAQQLLNLEQVIFAGFTHQPAVELSERLLTLLPDNQKKAFYSDNGSTSVEVALKMCIQYAKNNKLKKHKIAAFKNSYHGDTFGAMSVSGRGIWTQPFIEQLFEVEFIDTPNESNIEALIQQMEQMAAETLCFIYEPLVQGAAGMLMHEAKHLNLLMSACRKHRILLIQDEVFTGFGRTGKMFAANHLTEQPDIMCFSKGLTGGTLPLGITTCTEEIYQAFYSDDKQLALYHGHSFTASPLACTAALASMDLLLRAETQKSIARITNKHALFLDSIRNHPKVKTARQTGTIMALEWNTNENASYFSDIQASLYPYFLKKGILLRPLGNIIYLVPPYCITNKELEYIYKTIIQSFEDI